MNYIPEAQCTKRACAQRRQEEQQQQPTNRKKTDDNLLFVHAHADWGLQNACACYIIWQSRPESGGGGGAWYFIPAPYPHTQCHTHTHCGMSDRLIVYAIKDITRAETEIS